MSDSPKMPERQCGSCTACCEGWLHGVSYDKSFYHGKPCHFLGCNGCSIYPDRPKDPCQDYRCVWLDNPELPEWMQPHMSGVIVTSRPYKDSFYWEVMECGQKIDSAVLSWLVIYTLNTKGNLHYQVDGGWNKIGFHQEFLQDKSL